MLHQLEGVGAAFGLTPRRQQSGEIDRMGGISKCGDAMMRKMLFEAALVLMTHSRKWSWLKAWGMKIARHRGMKRAIIAVARRLAVIMHRSELCTIETQQEKTRIPRSVERCPRRDDG